MKGKSLITFLAIIFSITCLYELSYTWKAGQIDDEATVKAKGNPNLRRRYLDSISNKEAWMGRTSAETRQKALQMGLDLQGGISVTLESSIPDIITNLSSGSQDPNYQKAIQKARADNKANPQSDFITLFASNFEAIAPNDKLASPSIFGNRDMGDKIKSTMSNNDVVNVLRSEVSAQVETSFNVLKQRIDKLGVASPTIQRLPQKGRVLVELPGADDQERSEKMLTSAAQLEFWETYLNGQQFDGYKSAADKKLAEIMGGVTDSTKATNDSTAVATKDTANKEKTKEEYAKENPLSVVLNPNVYKDNQGQYKYAEGACVGVSNAKDTAQVNKYLAIPAIKGVFPADVRFVWSAQEEYGLGSRVFGLYAIKLASKNAIRANKPVISGNMISGARADRDGNKPAVSLEMTGEGTSLWRKVTKDLSSQNPKGAVAIIMDGAVFSAPTVQSEITMGRTQITGMDDRGAQDLANILNAGKMDAPFRVVEGAKVGSEIGASAAKSGLLSSLIGLLLIFVFVIAYYNKAGMVAAVVLAINLFFLIGVMASMGAVLTLPGIAGVVLSIGMAVDSNVLLYERVKENLRDGKSLRLSIDEAFSMQGAIPAILDSNITTLLTGVILLTFGSGSIKGFGVTLVAGIIISLFTSIFLTRVIFEWLMNKGQDIKFWIPATEKLMMDNDFDFIKGRKKFYIISAVIIALGILSIGVRGFSYGVDFQGGRSYVVKADKPLSEDALRSKLQVALPKAATQVKSYGGDNQVRIVTTYLLDDTNNTTDAKVQEIISTNANQVTAGSKIVSSQIVRSSIVEDIRDSAMWSVGLSLLVIFGYLLFRFGRFEFSIGAIAGLAYVVIFVLALFSIGHGWLPVALDIDQALIAALLTVVGYAINDTVVVFDRIREYLADNETKKDSVEVVINNALNSTLSRTVITGISVIGVLFILLVFGGDSIRGFALAMLVGVIVGTYSSLFVSSPIVVDLALRNKNGLTAGQITPEILNKV